MEDDPGNTVWFQTSRQQIRVFRHLNHHPSHHFHQVLREVQGRYA